MRAFARNGSYGVIIYFKGNGFYLTDTMSNKGMVEAYLRGNTLRVYIYALKKRRVGVREVQRALGLSNPSLAQYHLNKLKELGLIIEKDGEYELVNEVKVDLMRDFLRVGTLLVPRFVFYAVFYTVFAIYFTLYSYQFITYSPILTLLSGFIVLAAIIFWYEAQRAWRSAPSP